MPLRPFVDELPRLTKATPLEKRGEDGEACYEIEMQHVLHDFHADAPAIPVWAYNGLYPGPLIESIVNQPIQVTWVNRLPATGTFPFRAQTARDEK